MVDVDELDVIIIGGGMAGLEVARFLKSEKVLVVEAGILTSDLPVSVSQWCRPLTTDETWWPQFSSTSANHFSRGFGLRRRLGGRSLCWHGVSLPMEDYAYDHHWPEHTKSWTRSDNEPFSVHQKALAGMCFAPDGVTFDNYRVAPILRSSSSLPFRRDGVYTPLDHLRYDNGSILLGHQVHSVRKAQELFEVRVNDGGGSTLMRSRFVVFACGAAMNGFLRRELRPDLGRSFLRDHIVVGRSLIAEASSCRLPYPLQFRTIADLRTRVFVSVEGWSGGVKIDLWTMGADIGSFEAEIGDRRIEVCRDSILTSYAERCHELASLADAELNSIARQVGLGRPRFVGWDDRIDSHEATVRLAEGSLPIGEAVPFEGMLGAADHEHGSVPFGVVDQYGELIGCSGAFFAGPSCFPSLGGTNPTLSSLAQCRTTAERMSALT